MDIFFGRYKNTCYQMTKTYFGHLQKLPRTQTPPFLQHDTPLDAPEKKMIILQYRGRKNKVTYDRYECTKSK